VVNEPNEQQLEVLLSLSRRQLLSIDEQMTTPTQWTSPKAKLLLKRPKRKRTLHSGKYELALEVKPEETISSFGWRAISQGMKRLPPRTVRHCRK
jgi:hypothetical protein